MVRHSRRRFLRTWGASGLLLMAAGLSACQQRAVAPGQASRANEAAGTARSGGGSVIVAAATRPPVRPHVGYLTAEPAPTSGADFPDKLGFEWSRRRLGQLEWTVGRDLIMTPRYAEGQLDVLPDLVAELVRLEVAVILAAGPEAARAAVDVAKTTPIVVAVGADLTRAQLFGSDPQPSNVTGVAFEIPDLTRRRLSVLMDAMPRLSQVAILWNGANWAATESFGAIERAARALGVQSRSHDVRTGQDIENVLTNGNGSDAFIIVHDPLTFINRGRIVFFAERHRLPLMLERRSGLYSEGVLLEVGPNVQEMFFQAATHVDQVVRGVRAADLPMEPPAKEDFVVNLKTARAIGLTISPSVQTQATQLIQ
jgi:putative tryptophan/tyrosine transport system substrate-binding protein